jgi:hypothetical protein
MGNGNGNNNSSTQVIIAIIGLIGVLGAAWISGFFSHDKGDAKLTTPTPTVRQTPTPTPTPEPHPTPVKVRLLFQTKDPDGTVRYLYNTAEFRSPYLSRLLDKDYLYFWKCDILPESQRSNCGEENNWRGIPVSAVECHSVESCTREYYVLPEELRTQMLSQLKSSSGQPLDSSGQPK